MSRIRLPFRCLRAVAASVALVVLLAPRATAQYEEVWATKIGNRGTSGIHVAGRELAPDGSLWIAAGVVRKNSLDPWSGWEGLLLLRFDPEGRLAWMQDHFGATPFQNIRAALRLDSEGCAYVASQTNWVRSLAKYSPLGVELWRRPLDLTWLADEEVPMAIDGEGRILVAGSTPGVWAVDSDLQLVQFDSDGNLRWQVSYDGPQHGFDFPHHLAADAMGRAHLTAVSTREKYDPGNVILSLAFDGDGSLRWTSEYRTSASDLIHPHATEVLRDGTRTIAVAVHDPDKNGWTQTDFALVRIGPLGEPLWTVVEPNTPPTSRRIHELRTAPWGDLIVAGAKAKHGAWGGVKLTAQAEAWSPTGEKLWSQKVPMMCVDTWFEDVLILGDQSRVGFVTRTGTATGCSPFTAFSLEFYSAQGAPLGGQRIELPGSGGTVYPTGLVDAVGDLRLIGSAHLAWTDSVGVLYVGRYTPQ